MAKDLLHSISEGMMNSRCVLIWMHMLLSDMLRCVIRYIQM